MWAVSLLQPGQVHNSAREKCLETAGIYIPIEAARGWLKRGLCQFHPGVLLQKKGTNHSILLAAGITARISSMVWAPLVAWLAASQQK